MEQNEKNMSFVFYRSFKDSIDRLPLEQGYYAYKAIIDYGLDKVEPNSGDDLVLSVLFSMAKPLIDMAMKRRENGKKGGKPVTKDYDNSQTPKQNNKSPITIEETPF